MNDEKDTLIVFKNWRIIWNWKGWNPFGLNSLTQSRSKASEVGE